MIRVCLDVNVVVSGFPANSGVPAELVERWLRREFELILSEHVLSEAAEGLGTAVLGRPVYRR